MSGLFALLDDVAAIARLAAASVDDVSAAAMKVSAKAVGIVVDDTAVTPGYVTGISPSRELPIIWRIAKGSLVNKLVFILPAILVLSHFLPGAIPPILILGGLYLAFEGAEKVYSALTGHHDESAVSETALSAEELEQQRVSGAVRTDFILSAEIMVLSLGEVMDQSLLNQALILVLVGIAITALVYGVVGLLVKIDDIGLKMMGRKNAGTQRLGRVLVEGMPHIMSALSTIGTAAMLWVGGHILVTNIAKFGWHAPVDFFHRAAHAASALPLGGLFSWLTDTLLSAAVGLVVGLILVGLVHLFPKKATAE